MGEVRSDDGTAKLAALGGDRAAAFRRVLQDALSKLGGGNRPVVISGMAGSSIGWRELPYARLPFALDGRDVVWEEIEPRTFLISGLRSDDDIMRGEETEVIGARQVANATFVKPGTHSKHLRIDRGRVVAFRSFMTGELFDVLSKHSVLRHSTDSAAAFDADSFREGALEGARLQMSHALFHVRTRHVLESRPAASNTSFLSGVLVGAELASLAGDPRPIVLAAGERLRAAYVAAAETLGLSGRLTALPSDEADRLSTAGQAVVLELIRGASSA